MKISGADNANVSDETSYRASSVRSTRETKAEDLISEIVVENNEVVSFNDIAYKPNACAPLSVGFCLAQISGANACVVVYYLLPDFPILVLTAASNGAGKSCDVGRDILEA